MPQDPVADRLRPVQIPDALKASAWDAYEQATDADDLARRLKVLPIPDDVKADLWDLKVGSGITPVTTPSAPERTWTDTAKDVGTGLVKSGVGAFVGLGNLVQQIPGVSTAVDTLYGTPGLSQQAFTEAQQATTPTNVPQTIGKLAGDIGQVVVPGRAITSVASSLAARAPRGLQLATRAGVEGVAGAGLGVVQGGDPTTAGVISGAIPVVGKAAGKVASALKAQVPEHIMKALGPTKEKYKALAEKITPEVLKRRLGGSREALQQQAHDAAEEAGKAIDTALETQFGGQVVNVQPVQEALEQAKRRYINVVREFVPDADVVPKSFTQADAPVDVLFADTLADAKRLGYKGTAGELRTIFDDAVKDARNFAEDQSDLDAPRKLLEEIARRGGLGDDPGFAGSIRQLWENSTGMYVPPMSKTTKQSGRLHKARTLPSGAVAGVPGVVRKKGKTVDGMREILSDAGYHFDNTTDLLNAIDEARVAIESRRGSTKPLGELLRGMGIRPGTRWWDADAAGQGGGWNTKDVVLDARAVKQIDKLQQTLAEHGQEMTVDQLVAVRRVWDTVVAQAGGFAHRAPGGIGIPLKDATEAWAKRKATSAIRQLLDSEVPQLSALNKEFSFWKSLDDVLSQTLKRTAPQGPGLKSIAAEGAGRMAGAITSTGGAAATVGKVWVLGKLVKLADHAFSSPRWQFATAKMKDDLAEAIVNGKIDKAVSALARVLAVQGSKAVPVGAQ